MSSVLEQYGQALMAIAFAVPCLLMAHRLWQVWRDPMAIEDGAWVRIGIGVFVMEFILTHAGIFMAGIAADATSNGTRWSSALGLTAFYGLFAIAISVGFQSRMLFHSFLWLIGGRFLALVIGISEHAAALLMAHAIVAAVIYFAMVFLSVFLPWPRFGITPEVATSTRVPNATGAWVDHPHRAIGAATVYFFLLGIAELALLSWMEPGRIKLS